jgi:hypothetical protein
MSGYFFAPRGSARAETLPRDVTDKFDLNADAYRIFDSGDIILYDLERLLARAPTG